MVLNPSNDSMIIPDWNWINYVGIFERISLAVGHLTSVRRTSDRQPTGYARITHCWLRRSAIRCQKHSTLKEGKVETWQLWPHVRGLQLPVCIPILSRSWRSGLCLTLNFFTELRKSRLMLAISATCLLPFRTGRPLTTMYASPIVSTLYTSCRSTIPSNRLYKSFSRSTTCGVDI